MKRGGTMGWGGLATPAALFAGVAAVEMLLMAPRADLASPRVWLTVLTSHGLVLGGVLLVALALGVIGGLLAELRAPGARRDRGLGERALAVGAVVTALAHGWPVVKDPLSAVAGRPVALALTLVALVGAFELARRRLAPRPLVLVTLCVLAALLGYYLLRSEPLGLPARSRLFALTGLGVFALAVAAALRVGRWRVLLLAVALSVFVVGVRWAAPAPHAPVPQRVVGGEGEPPAVRHPVILVVIDTLRADALDLDGGAAGRTPHLAELAAESDVYTGAVANASWTLPAHASLFTGRRVSAHRVDMTSAAGFGSRLDPALPTLHERFAARGYATVCVTANGIVGPASDLTRGCERYLHPGRAWTLQTAPLRLWYALSPSARPAMEEQAFTLLTGLRRHATAGEVLRRALGELDRAEAPPYLFVNLMDAHRPYPAAPDVPLGDTLAFARDLLGVLAGVGDPEAFDRRHASWLRRSYLAQVGELDRELGAFFAELRDRGLYDGALIVVTADHGEAFFDNAELPLYFDHHGAYEAAVRIPLVVKRPGGGGRRHDGLVEQSDLAPALLALAAGDREVDGLLGAEGDVAVTEWNPHPEPGAMSTLPVQRVGLYRGRHKLVFEGAWREAEPGASLFDLADGPFETSEVAAERSELAAELGGELRRLLEAEWAVGDALAEGDGEADPELLETLRSLGYID